MLVDSRVEVDFRENEPTISKKYPKARRYKVRRRQVGGHNLPWLSKLSMAFRGYLSVGIHGVKVYKATNKPKT